MGTIHDGAAARLLARMDLGAPRREVKALALKQVAPVGERDGVGVFEGYVAVFGNRDGNGDIIDRGAFAQTLRDLRARKAETGAPCLFPILWQHDERDPIGGYVDAQEDAHGLWVRGELDLNAPNGKRAYSALKRGYLSGLSIGYDPVRTAFVGGVRHLTEIRLWEGSVVTFPANQQATVAAVKARQRAAPARADVPDAVAARLLARMDGAAPESRSDPAGAAARGATTSLDLLAWAEDADPRPDAPDGTFAHTAWVLRATKRASERRYWKGYLP